MTGLACPIFQFNYAVVMITSDKCHSCLDSLRFLCFDAERNASWIGFEMHRGQAKRRGHSGLCLVSHPQKPQLTRGCEV